jgi:hypothetical protein
MKAFGLIVLLFVTLSCMEEQKTSELTVEKEKSSSMNMDYLVDESVVGIKIGDPESSKKVVGLEILNKREDYKPLFLTNTSGDEVLELHLHGGSLHHQFNHFSLRKKRSGESTHLLAGTTQFVTSKGIRLGMSFDDLVAIFGKPDENIYEEKERVVLYRFEGMDKSKLLKDMNMPVYFGSYHFDINDELIRASWGLEVP